VDPTARRRAAPRRQPALVRTTCWDATSIRVVYGARVSPSGFRWPPLPRSSVSIGLFSGFCVGDAILIRVMDGLMSIPPILLAVALMALTRGASAI
jgi:peptide/nickel transport system permease protein